MFKALGRLIFFWMGVRYKYDRINEDPQWKESSVRMGVESILRSIFGAVFTLLFVFCSLWLFTGGVLKSMSGAEALAAVIIYPLIFVVAIGCALGALMFYLRLSVAGILYARYQLKLNKKPIGYVALVLSILLSIGTIAAGVLLLGSFSA